MNLYDKFQKDAASVVLSIENRYFGDPKGMVRVLLGQSSKLDYNSPWFWWVVNAIRLALQEHEQSMVRYHGPKVSIRLFIDWLELSDKRKGRLYDVVRAIVESASFPRQEGDKCKTEDLDMAIHMAWGYVNREDFPWVPLVRIAARRTTVTSQNSVDAYQIMSGNAMLNYFNCHTLPEHTFIDLCVCLNIHQPSPTVVGVLTKSCESAHALTREDLLRDHNVLLYWKLAHALMDDSSVEACTRNLVVHAVVRVAHYLQARRIRLFRFAMHRLTELVICGATCSDSSRIILRRLICEGLNQKDVHLEAYFGNLDMDSIDKAYWEHALGPGLFRTLINGVSHHETKCCAITSQTIYHEIKLPAGSDTVSIDMETLVRHMTVNHCTNPLTNQEFTREELTKVTGNLVSEFSGTSEI